MSSLGRCKTSDDLNEAIIDELKNIAEDYAVEIRESSSCERMLKNLLRSLNKGYGPVVVLIDEYDKFILDNINNLKKAEEMREILRSFYGVLKSCDEYLSFVFITGISKFSKMGVFSAMNNLEDISLDEDYSDIVGYTQKELEDNFAAWIESVSRKMKIEINLFLEQLKDYYYGFSFDGKVKLYNPFSIMQCLKKAEFDNYWYVSGSSTFIVNYMKSHSISDPDTYRHFAVSANFLDSHEIEKAKPESFLYQSGYLTIEKRENEQIILDYPNWEIYKSITRMYLEDIYRVDSYISLGSELWKTLSDGNISKAVELYNTALAAIPYEDFTHRDEYWYRSLFLMLLRGAGITALGEVHIHKGRADMLVKFPQMSLVLEFKFAENSSEVEQKVAVGKRQMEDREYAKSYCLEGHNVITAVIVADDEKRTCTASL